ncbi:MAG: polyprenyl synthetase family protein, partial [Pseudobutyrivibrio sp.]|nr:polyprenyl synthetase family protein [Pseudobutyrivibrio sp.]
FQIQDDILDVEGDEAVLGKPVGSDEKNFKATYVTFAGIERSKDEVKKLTMEAVELLDSLPYENPFLKELLLYLVYRQN